MILLGVDPGVDPALVVFDAELGVIEPLSSISAKVEISKRAKTRPVPELIRVALERARPDHLFLEEVGAMPRQGIASTAAFMRAAGMVHGVAVGLGVPVRLMLPQEWRRLAKVRGDKDDARARACQLWPGQAGLFARKSDHNRAEAALIAYAGWCLLTSNGR